MKLVVGTFLSLDGVMQAPGGDEDCSGGFERGGWAAPYFDDTMARLTVAWTERCDVLLLGRKTYEIFAAYWPHADDERVPIAAKLNSVTKRVASRTLRSLDWAHSQLIEGDVAHQVAKLKKQSGREIQVAGSGDLVRTLLEYGLVDEFRLWTFPVVLGKGKKLFAEGAVPAEFQLIDTRTTGAGVVVNCYRTRGVFA
ncbi:MAG TPA: dihydrofolate reductase family protein [Luteimonas sp.]|nr:dihydrofolate reductase family protein [Luteimonas sp.]